MMIAWLKTELKAAFMNGIERSYYCSNRFLFIFLSVDSCISVIGGRIFTFDVSFRKEGLLLKLCMLLDVLRRYYIIDIIIYYKYIILFAIEDWKFVIKFCKRIWFMI